MSILLGTLSAGSMIEWYPTEGGVRLQIQPPGEGTAPVVISLTADHVRRLYSLVVPSAAVPGLIPPDSPARPAAEQLRAWLRSLGSRGEDSPVGPVVPSARRWWVLVDSWLSAPAGDVGQVQPGDHEPPAGPSHLIV